MTGTFSFESFAFKEDPDFEGMEWTKMEELINKVVTINSVKLVDAKKNDGTPTQAVRFSYTLEGENFLRYSYSKSYGIVNTFLNIIDKLGEVPAVPVRIVTVQTKNGNTGYALRDVAE